MNVLTPSQGPPIDMREHFRRTCLQRQKTKTPLKCVILEISAKVWHITYKILKKTEWSVMFRDSAQKPLRPITRNQADLVLSEIFPVIYTIQDDSVRECISAFIQIKTWNPWSCSFMSQNSRLDLDWSFSSNWGLTWFLLGMKYVSEIMPEDILTIELLIGHILLGFTKFKREK